MTGCSSNSVSEDPGFSAGTCLIVRIVGRRHHKTMHNVGQVKFRFLLSVEFKCIPRITQSSRSLSFHLIEGRLVLLSPNTIDVYIKLRSTEPTLLYLVIYVGHLCECGSNKLSFTQAVWCGTSCSAVQSFVSCQMVNHSDIFGLFVYLF